MNKQINRLDQQLAEADRALFNNDTKIQGAVVRSRADQLARRRAVQMRNVSVLVMLALILAGWRMMTPTADRPDGRLANQQHANPTQQPLLGTAITQHNVDRLNSEIESIRRQQQLVKYELEILNAQRRLLAAERRINKAIDFPNPGTATYQRNANSWTALKLMANWESRELTESERANLQLLVRGFPKTTAGLVAQEMLSTNQVSRLLCESQNEL